MRRFVVAEPAADAVPEATVRERPEGGFRLEFELRGAEGTTARRSLDAAECDLLADATALLAAVAIDPVGAAARATAPEEPRAHAVSDHGAGEPAATGHPHDAASAQVVEPASAERAAETVAPPRASDRAAAERTATVPRRIRGVARGFASGGFGALPRFGAGLGAAVGLMIPWFRVEATGTYWLDRRRDYADDPGVGGTFRMWAFGGRMCVEPQVRRLTIPACVGAEGGRTRSQGVGVDEARVRPPGMGGADDRPGDHVGAR